MATYGAGAGYGAGLGMPAQGYTAAYSGSPAGSAGFRQAMHVDFSADVSFDASTLMNRFLFMSCRLDF